MQGDLLQLVEIITPKEVKLLENVRIALWRDDVLSLKISKMVATMHYIFNMPAPNFLEKNKLEVA